MAQTRNHISDLKWHLEVGADAILQETPRNWLRSETAAPQVSARAAAPVSPATNNAPAPQARPENQSYNGPSALEIAKAATSLKELEEQMRAFEGCPLKLRATNMVFGSGNEQADLMFVGDAPSREDDMLGSALNGPVGALFVKMLTAINIKVEDVFVSHVVPWRPPGNRTATPAEVQSCLAFLNRQIELVRPKTLITLGELATKTIRNETRFSIARQRGSMSEVSINENKTQNFCMYHPQFLLQQPKQKRAAWADLLALQSHLESV